MTDIKTMQLYPAPERIERELSARGFAGEVPVATLAELDQLHYHGAQAVDVAISALGINAQHNVLEIGSGWGGPSRWIAHRTGARVAALELQDDYDTVGRRLTARTALDDRVQHICGDFLTASLDGGYDHVVSWLALYHIPDRARYLGRIRDVLKPGGRVWIEDLALRKPIPDAEIERFKNAMFPNSIRPARDYGSDLHAAGFETVDVADMTDSWHKFVADRLAAFRAGKDAYCTTHGADGYQALETFYSAVAGYFEDGTLAGVRVQAG